MPQSSRRCASQSTIPLFARAATRTGPRGGDMCAKNSSKSLFPLAPSSKLAACGVLRLTSAVAANPHHSRAESPRSNQPALRQRSTSRLSRLSRETRIPSSAETIESALFPRRSKISRPPLKVSVALSRPTLQASRMMTSSTGGGATVVFPPPWFVSLMHSPQRQALTQCKLLSLFRNSRR
jgi:hypothetical protein